MSPKVDCNPPRKIYQYHKTDSEGLSSSLKTAVDKFFENNPENNTVESNWLHFKNLVHTHMENHIPHKMSKSKQSHPWINPHIVRQMRKRHKLYLKAKNAGSDIKPMLTRIYKK